MNQEFDYSDPSADDFEALSRDKVEVRSLQASDLDALVRQCLDEHVVHLVSTVSRLEL